MKDKTTWNEHPDVSGELKQFIEAIVKDILLNGKKLGDFEGMLKMYLENENVDYEPWKHAMEMFIETMRAYANNPSQALFDVARFPARKCFVSPQCMGYLAHQLKGKQPPKRPNLETQKDTSFFRVDNGVIYAKRKVVGRVAIPSQLNGQTITDIGERAFAECTDLKSIVIPDSVIGIGNNAFRQCRGLTSVTFPSDLSEIGEWAFGDCIGLTSIEIPSKTVRIGNNAFARCHNLASVAAFATQIGNLSFYQCSGLKELYLNDSVKTIGNNAFLECRMLDAVVLPNTITEIQSGTFANCSSLEWISIPESVTKIGDSAFCGCSALKNIRIPNSVTKIGNGVFSYCTGLEIIYIHDASLLKNAGLPKSVQIETSYK